MARVVVEGVNANEEETPFRKDSIPGAVIGVGFAHVHLLGRARSEWAPALLRDAVLAHGAREQIPDHLRAVVGRVDVVDLRCALRRLGGCRRRRTGYRSRSRCMCSRKSWT